ncbi:MAG: hypothetical protein H7Y42_16255 [Chitinophagaceae bacterium]|nr:hypothetical protein [Chitinophagaceae bacterium]
MTTPTIQELQRLELPLLLDMLVQQTATYTQFLKQEGNTPRTLACRETIINIQEAVELCKSSENDEERPASNLPPRNVLHGGN